MSAEGRIKYLIRPFLLVSTRANLLLAYLKISYLFTVIQTSTFLANYFHALYHI